jgi:electron transfer flavoprotein alpha subunit
VSVLVVAEHTRGQVRDITYELITAGQALGGPLAMASIGADPGALDLNRAGVDEIIHVRVPQADFENDVYQQALEALVAERRPDHILVGFTVNSLGYAPAVAAKLGLAFASDVFALRRDGDATVATRAFYGSKVHAELDFPGERAVILMLRPTIWAAAGAAAAEPSVTELDVSIAGSRARHKEFLDLPKADVDITGADFLLAIGRGIGDKENIALFERLSEKMAATLASSRPLVDAGWMPSSRQVGQSGKTVKPKVYLALGISGAVQHLAGMKASGTIIAINKDPEAALFNAAHYGAVADLFEVARELEKLY